MGGRQGLAATERLADRRRTVAGRVAAHRLALVARPSAGRPLSVSEINGWSVDAGDADASQKQFDLFIASHGQSAYGAPARLIFARLLVARNDLDRALVQVRTVADTATDLQLRQVAKLRMARLQTAMGKPDDALATLGSADVGSFQSAYAEARGDALQAKGDAAGALREYEAAKAARSASSATGAESDLLALKIHDLQEASP